MLVIKCAKCKQKLWKYEKIGHGEVLRCHKDRISQYYCTLDFDGHKISCPCGRAIAIDRGSFYKMDPKAFLYNGTKKNQ